MQIRKRLMKERHLRERKREGERDSEREREREREKLERFFILVF